MSSNLQPTAGRASTAATVKRVAIADDHGHVNQDRIHLDRTDVLEWTSMDGKESTVEFRSAKGSPFQAKVFHVPGNGSSPTAAVRQDAGTGEYKYDVIGEKGENDPVVIIDN